MNKPFMTRPIRGIGAIGSGQIVVVRESDREFKIVMILLGGMLRVEGSLSISAAHDIAAMFCGDESKASRPGMASDFARETITAVGHRPLPVTHSTPRPVPESDGDDDGESDF